MFRVDRLAVLSLLGVLTLAAPPLPAQNLATNGEFDGGLAGWTASTNVFWLEFDHDGCDGSGSARFVPSLNAGDGIHQVIPWSPGAPRFWSRLTYRARPTPPPLDRRDGSWLQSAWGSDSGLLTLGVAAFETANCSGTSQFSVSFQMQVEEYLEWRTVDLTTPSSFPAGTQCLVLGVSWTWRGGPVTEVEVDAVELATRYPRFFGDFELDGNASTCRWSSSVGEPGGE